MSFGKRVYVEPIPKDHTSTLELLGVRGTVLPGIIIQKTGIYDYNSAFSKKNVVGIHWSLPSKHGGETNISKQGMQPYV